MNIDARPLNAEERRVLDVLLAEDFDSAAALREQAADALVVGCCDCGCPSVYLTPQHDAPQGRVDSPLAPVEGRIASESEEEPPGEIILFVDDGRLSYLEYVYYGTVPNAWPSTDRISTVVLR